MRMADVPAIHVENRGQELDRLQRILRAEISGTDEYKCDDFHSKHPAVVCPRCSSENVLRRGHDSFQRQRLQCKHCNRSFTSHSLSPLRSTNLPLDTWLAFASCHVDCLSLRKTAAICKVTLKTAFTMRHRLNAVLEDHLGASDSAYEQRVCKEEEPPESERSGEAPKTIRIAIRSRDSESIEMSVGGSLFYPQLIGIDLLSRTFVKHVLTSVRANCLMARTSADEYHAFDCFLKRFRGVSFGRITSYLAWHMFKTAESIRPSSLHLARLIIDKLKAMLLPDSMIAYDLPVRPFAERWVQSVNLR